MAGEVELFGGVLRLDTSEVDSGFARVLSGLSRLTDAFKGASAAIGVSGEEGSRTFVEALVEAQREASAQILASWRSAAATITEAITAPLSEAIQASSEATDQMVADAEELAAREGDVQEQRIDATRNFEAERTAVVRQATAERTVIEEDGSSAAVRAAERAADRILAIREKMNSAIARVTMTPSEYQAFEARSRANSRNSAISRSGATDEAQAEARVESERLLNLELERIEADRSAREAAARDAEMAARQKYWDADAAMQERAYQEWLANEERFYASRDAQELKADDAWEAERRRAYEQWVADEQQFYADQEASEIRASDAWESELQRRSVAQKRADDAQIQEAYAQLDRIRAIEDELSTTAAGVGATPQQREEMRARSEFNRRQGRINSLPLSAEENQAFSAQNLSILNGQLTEISGRYASAAEDAARLADAQTEVSSSAGEVASAYQATTDAIVGSQEAGLSHLGQFVDEVGHRIRRFFIDMAVMYATFEGAHLAYESLIGINSELEQMRISLAAVINAQASITQGGVQMAQGPQRFAVAQQEANKLVEQFRIDAIRTVFTSQDLVQAAVALSAPIMSAGRGMRTLREMTNLTATAAAVLGLPLQEAARQVQEILTGAEMARTPLVRLLGGRPELERELSTYKDRLTGIEAILGRFRIAADAHLRSWQGVTSSVRDFAQILSSVAGGAMFGALEQDMLGVLHAFTETKNGSLQLKQSLRDMAADAGQRLLDLYNGMRDAVSAAVPAFESLAGAVGSLEPVLLVLLDNLTLVLRVVDALRGPIGVLAAAWLNLKIVMGISGMLQTLIAGFAGLVAPQTLAARATATLAAAQGKAAAGAVMMDDALEVEAGALEATAGAAAAAGEAIEGTTVAVAGFAALLDPITLVLAAVAGGTMIWQHYADAQADAVRMTEEARQASIAATETMADNLKQAEGMADSARSLADSTETAAEKTKELADLKSQVASLGGVWADSFLQGARTASEFAQILEHLIATNEKAQASAKKALEDQAAAIAGQLTAAKKFADQTQGAFNVSHQDQDRAAAVNAKLFYDNLVTKLGPQLNDLNAQIAAFKGSQIEVSGTGSSHFITDKDLRSKIRAIQERSHHGGQEGINDAISALENLKSTYSLSPDTQLPKVENAIDALQARLDTMGASGIRLAHSLDAGTTAAQKFAATINAIVNATDKNGNPLPGSERVQNLAAFAVAQVGAATRHTAAQATYEHSALMYHNAGNKAKQAEYTVKAEAEKALAKVSTEAATKAHVAIQRLVKATNHALWTSDAALVKTTDRINEEVERQEAGDLNSHIREAMRKGDRGLANALAERLKAVYGKLADAKINAAGDTLASSLTKLDDQEGTLKAAGKWTPGMEAAFAARRQTLAANFGQQVGMAKDDLANNIANTNDETNPAKDTRRNDAVLNAADTGVQVGRALAKGVADGTGANSPQKMADALFGTAESIASAAGPWGDVVAGVIGMAQTIWDAVQQQNRQQLETMITESKFQMDMLKSSFGFDQSSAESLLKTSNAAALVGLTGPEKTAAEQEQIAGDIAFQNQQKAASDEYYSQMRQDQQDQYQTQQSLDAGNWQQLLTDWQNYTDQALSLDQQQADAALKAYQDAEQFYQQQMGIYQSMAAKAVTAATLAGFTPNFNPQAMEAAKVKSEQIQEQINTATDPAVIAGLVAQLKAQQDIIGGYYAGQYQENVGNPKAQASAYSSETQAAGVMGNVSGDWLSAQIAAAGGAGKVDMVALTNTLVSSFGLTPAQAADMLKQAGVTASAQGQASTTGATYQSDTATTTAAQALHTKLTPIQDDLATAVHWGSAYMTGAGQVRAYFQRAMDDYNQAKSLGADPVTLSNMQAQIMTIVNSWHAPWGRVPGLVPHFATGGIVPGSGSGDTVPAWLSPREGVLTDRQVQSLRSISDIIHQGLSAANYNRSVMALPGGGSVVINMGGVTVTSQKDADNLADTIANRIARSQKVQGR